MISAEKRHICLLHTYSQAKRNEALYPQKKIRLQSYTQFCSTTNTSRVNAKKWFFGYVPKPLKTLLIVQ